MTERLRRACELLEGQPATPLAAIAEAAGFGSPAVMRHHFRSRLGTSPDAYRKRSTGGAGGRSPGEGRL